MRIQHNIPAMNAYRNYNANTKALQGNLQKLSSGYKINKAGDDAAGLAISEKMRAQITGLEVAQKNAKDGISLVQTAEGALTEVHTMLNRMYSLAEQSANGTYADDVDREQLQKEVVSLRDEINRIADASNFNGKKLLDGSLSSGGSGGAGSVTTSLATTTVEATKGEYKTLALSNTAADSVTMSFSFADESGSESIVNFELTFGAHSGGATADANKGVYLNGKHIGDVAAPKVIAAGEVKNILTNAFKEVAPDILSNFDITDGATTADGTIVFTAKEAGAGTMELKSYTHIVGSTASNSKVTTETKASDAFDTIDVAKIVANQAWDGTEANLEKSIFEVAGEKFVVASAALTDAQKTLLANAGVGNNVTVKQTNDYDTANALAAVINQATGLSTISGKIDTGEWKDHTATPAAGETLIALKPGSGKSGGSGKGGLTLQIGDTADKYNKMTVSVNDCHAKAMGVGSINIGTQDGAAKAMDAIKGAINYVSDVRGTLGSLQNRLDHTINNLSVQQENIQDAEATIRDVDVANEMMAYTKNNILVQSAQAMLAQANQLPQGVLQLLG